MFGALASVAWAAFDTQQVAANVKVKSIYRGYYGEVYVTFAPAILALCSSNEGGYLTSSWPEARGANTDPVAAKDQMAMLMSAKATDATIDVYYRKNLAGTGWNNCAIDAIFLK